MSIVSTVSRALGRRRGGGGSARRFLLSSLSYRISSNVDDDINIVYNSRRSASTSTTTSTTSNTIKSEKKSQTSTVDTRETKKFEQDAQLWWRERDGPFGPLHSMNPARCSFIRDECVEHFLVVVINLTTTMQRKEEEEECMVWTTKSPSLNRYLV